MRRCLPIAALCLAACTWASRARAVDLPVVAGAPMKLDVTETSIVAQQFHAREDQGEDPKDHGYGVWTNRLNGALKWGDFTVGTRLDSSLYWARPETRDICAPGETGGCTERAQVGNTLRDGASRFRDSLYPAKIYATYKRPGFELTAGDAYAQFGRGLILSVRKVDELGVDTTLRGGRLVFQRDIVGVTLVAGVANPTRVDEATGRALFLPRELAANPALGIAGDRSGPQPVFGSDRIVGAQIQAGRGTPFVTSFHAVRLTRCAPFSYLPTGRVNTDFFDAPIGSCAPADTRTWIDTLPKSVNPLIAASEVDMAATSLEMPNLLSIGGPQKEGGASLNVYLEGAVQRRFVDKELRDPLANGNAVYGSVTASSGPVTSTLEVKSYRNFYALGGAVDQSRASAFSNVQYSTPPTAELLLQDSMFGFFNACVNGGRLRTDVRLASSVLVYGQGIYSHTKTEVPGGGCDEAGRTIVPTGSTPEQVRNVVWDGLSGIEWSFESDKSHVFASGGVRHDDKESGEPYYREVHAEYTITKHLAGPVSLELSGRHRLRREDLQNVRNAQGFPEYWRQGEHYTAVKIAPKWVFTQGIEYTTLVGFPTTYYSGSVLYRFTSDSNIRVFAGQQRGGLKCVSGICKVFPAFEGARVELTLRF
jgi:hypothetical protein